MSRPGGLHSDRKGEEGADWGLAGRAAGALDLLRVPLDAVIRRSQLSTVTWERGGQRNGPSHPLRGFICFSESSGIEYWKGKKWGERVPPNLITPSTVSSVPSGSISGRMGGPKNHLWPLYPRAHTHSLLLHLGARKPPQATRTGVAEGGKSANRIRVSPPPTPRPCPAVGLTPLP